MAAVAAYNNGFVALYARPTHTYLIYVHTHHTVLYSSMYAFQLMYDGY